MSKSYPSSQALRKKKIIENRRELMGCSLWIVQVLLINTEGNKQGNIVPHQLTKTEPGCQGPEKLEIKDFRNQYYVCAI